jgi:hypothetical protein
MRGDTMMTTLQWAGFLGTLGGYWLLVYRSRLWGAALSFAGVSALGLWAGLVGAWPVVGLEVAFMAVNGHIIIQESRHGH